MYQPTNPHVIAPPTKKVKLLAAGALAGCAMFALAIIILSLQLITLRRHIDQKDQKINDFVVLLEKSTDELTKTKRQLIVHTLLPPLDSFSSQCPGGNANDALFTPLSAIPIENYNVFLVDCRSNITTGKSLPRVVIFRVLNDGSKELTYGSNAAEPLCITNKLPVANKLADRLQLPICQTN